MARRKITKLPAPFVEETETPLILIFEYSKTLTREEFTRETQTLILDIQNFGVQSTNVETTTVAPESNWLQLELLSTNIDFEQLRDIREKAMNVDGFRNMIVSTIPIKDIQRLNI